MRLNSSEIYTICKLQHQIVVSNYYISKMPMGYTNMDISRFESDMKIRAINEKCTKELDELIKTLINKYGADVIKNTFSDKEYLQLLENRFTFDDQRQATKEVIGKELTLEEVFEL